MWTGQWKVCVLPVLLIIGSASECMFDPCCRSVADMKTYEVCGFGQAYIFATAKTTHSAFATVCLLASSFCAHVVTRCMLPRLSRGGTGRYSRSRW